MNTLQTTYELPIRRSTEPAVITPYEFGLIMHKARALEAQSAQNSEEPRLSFELTGVALLTMTLQRQQTISDQAFRQENQALIQHFEESFPSPYLGWKLAELRSGSMHITTENVTQDEISQ